jgi:serine/threonine protein kinase
MFDGVNSCISVSSFKKIGRIGEGTYGLVYKAQHKTTKDIVALKRILMHNETNEGFPSTSLREISCLRRCLHPNIVKFFGITVGKERDAVFLVFEYCEHDLANLLKNHSHPFKESEIKHLVFQLLSAVEFLHENWVVHRDIKPANLLYNSKGQLKLADFGLARRLSFPSPAALTGGVVTLWYRAPEVLLDCPHYSFPIDLWSIGCIMGELLLQAPLLPGNDDRDQLKLIFSLLGCRRFMSSK